MNKTERTSYLLAAIFLLFLAHSFFLSCLAEDSFISFRFAENLAGGHGLVWNIGEKPVEGYTNFLWVLISASLIKLRLNVLWFSRAIGILAGLLALWYTYRFSWKMLGLSRSMSLIPCFFLALSGPFAAWAASGMEMNLFALLILIGGYHFTGYWKSRVPRDLYFSFLFLFFATLTRPEGFLIFGLVLVLGLVLFFLNKIPLRNLILPLLAYVLPFLAYFIWRFRYFGFLLPNTYYAKTGGSTLQYLRGLDYLGFFALFFLAPFLPVVLWLILGKRRGLFRTLRLPDLAESIKKKPGISLSLVVFLIYSVYVVYVGGDYMAMYRFFVPVLPFISLVFGYIVAAVFAAVSRSRLKKALLAGFVFLFAAATLIQSTPLEKALFRKPGFMHGSYRGIETERWHSRRLALLGKFFDRYKNSYDESVASTAIGAISYYADMKIIDFFGLVDPYLAHREVRHLGSGMPGHEKLDLDYLFSKRPTYIMYRREFTRNPRSINEFWNHPIIRNEYKVTAVWLKDRENGEEGYFSFLELKDTPHDPRLQKYLRRDPVLGR